MSAWSSSTGKAQLSYADRLRQASKSNPTPKQEPAPTPSGFATRAVQQNAAKPAPASASTSLSAAGSQSRRLSSASSTGAASASASAAREAAGPSDVKSGSTAEIASPATQASNGPTVNVWEARRKQLAEREAEKERERRAAPTPQKQAASPASATPSASGASHKSRQNIAGPKKSNERHSKGSSTSSQSDRKAVKSGNQASVRAPTSASIPSTSTRATTTLPTVPISNSPNASSPKPKLVASRTDAPEGAQTANKKIEVSASAEAAQVPGSSSKVPKTQTDAMITGFDAPKDPSTQKQDVDTSVRSQSAAAQISPSEVPPSQTVSAPTAIPDDFPGSPATVASAIEEVLKNGGAHGAQTEDDDAWLARIHLLNGGQNMPNFGGFGANGVPALNEEAEMQAAKKAERAVAAAWGAGKSVWNKSHQNNQQPSAASDSKATEFASSAGAGVKDEAVGSARGDSDVKEKGADIPSTDAAAANGIASKSNEVRGQEAHKVTTSEEKTATSDTDASSSKRATSPKPVAPAQPQKTGKRAAKTKVANLPSFEDVNNWPSPLDAGKKPADKPKAAAAGAGDADKAEQNKTGPSKTPKSLYETLDELQVRLAPGVNPQPSGSVAGARKGKQQWVPILPEITHTSAPASGAKPNRSAPDARTAKAGQKQQQSQQQQQRKEGNRSSQTQQSVQSGKKDGGQKQKAARREGKGLASDGTADAAAGAKAGEPQTGSGKAGGKSNAASQGPAVSVQQSNEAEQTQVVNSDESTPAGGEPQPNPSSATVPFAREDSSSKQPQSQQQTRINVRPQPNGNSTSSLQPHPNGVRPSKSPTSSGAGTPATNRSSPRGSVVSSPKAHPLPRPAPQATPDLSTPYAAPTPPMYYGPSGVATPMLSSSQPPPPYPTSWLPYNAYARPFLFDSTAQTGASLPSGVLGQLLGQIEFYFSQRNLEGDFFLRQKMDEEGWVEIGVVAGFKRVKGIVGEDEGGMVRDALGWSKVLDVDAARGRVRRRYGWELYTMKGTGGGEDAAQGRGKDEEDDDEALGVVSASGFGGKLEV